MHHHHCCLLFVALVTLSCIFNNAVVSFQCQSSNMNVRLGALAATAKRAHHQQQQQLQPPALTMNFFESLKNSFSPQKQQSASFSTQRVKTVAITGASGLLGTALTQSLVAQGITVVPVSTRFALDELAGKLEGVDAIVNLAGENVASGDGALAFLGRWSDTKKESILKSRVDGTKLLVDTVKTLKKKPKVLISASGVGYYGYTDSSLVFDETAPKGSGFLADLSESWEAEALKAQSLGVPSVVTRFSVILSNKGGVVGKLYPLFYAFLGGVIGSGKQAFSFVTISDAVRVIQFILEKPAQLQGVVNVAAPLPTTNEGFTKAFGSALGRPTLFPLPEFVAKTVFGQMGEEMLLGGQQAVPSKLVKAGFKFESEDIDAAMKAVLTKP